MGNAATCGKCSKQKVINNDISLESNKKSLDECKQSKEKFEQPKEKKEQFIKDNEQSKENNEMTTECNEQIIKNSKQNKGDINDEMQIGSKYIPLEMSNKANESICKITIIKNKEDRQNNVCATGFFMKITKSLKFLFTNNHVINQDLINNNIEIEIEIWNKVKMNLNLNQRYIRYFEKPEDVTIIEIKEDDTIYKDIKFLDYDSNYKEKGYNFYKNVDIFTLSYPLGGSVAESSGKLLDINNYEFTHSISTDTGSSGCPIILLNNNINSILVIGIHKCSITNIFRNGGTFIGKIIDEVKNDPTFFPKIRENEEEKDFSKKKTLEISEDKGNVITAKIYIKKEEENNFIKIINSHENYMEYNNKTSLQKFKNKKEIEECEIRLNNELIKFNYLHRFKKEGNYTITYSFKNKLTNINNLFSECSSLISIDLSNFNTQNLKNMGSIFYGCSSLKDINLSNFNTKNVIDMNSLFYGCSSLIKIDLSNFSTQNVTDMNSMFYGCSSLKEIDLTKFNTQNVKNMGKMFYKCSSLKDIDLSNFKTHNVTDMGYMFYGCSSLKIIKLTNFKTNNVTDMSSMFYECSSLDDIDLSSFNTKNITDMNSMFSRRSSLISVDLSNFYIQNVKNMCKMFSGCSSLVSINIYNFNPAKFSKSHGDIKKELCCMFNGCSALKRRIDIKDYKIREIIKKMNN